MAKLIFGCGYLGRRVAERWQKAGEQVFAVTRSPARGEDLALAGISPVIADITKPQTLADIPEAEEVLFAVGHDRESGPTIEEVYVDGLRNVLTALSRRKNAVRRLVYISSTGVYGQTSGETVNEASPCRPTRRGGRACLAAEELLRRELAEQTIVLRLAGIYGPGRLPRLDDLRAGRPLAAPSDGWLNLIHVDDAAELVGNALSVAQPPKLYVVADGQPVLRKDYYSALAELIGAPPPVFVPADADSPAAQRAGSDKRVDPAKLFAETSFRPRYGDYRAGLAEILCRE